MKCFANKIDFCQLIQESWKAPTLDFGDTDISNDTFEYRIISNSRDFTYTAEINNGIRLIDGKLIIDDPELEIGRYSHELIWVRDGIKTLLFQGSLTVTSKGGCNPNCQDEYTIIADPCEETIEIEITQTSINIQGATIDVDSTETVEPDEPAKVENVGTDSDVKLKFFIPKGNKGDQGDSIEVEWDGTKLGVRVEGDNEYYYSELKGDTGKGLEFEWRGTELGVRAAGDSDYIYTDLKGEKGEAFKYDDFTSEQLENLKGDKGDAATITVGNVETGEPDSEVEVTNSGDENNAVLNFKIPKGEQGDNLIASYTSSGNKEVTIQSFDLSTNTFTCNGHGLKNGDILYVAAIQNLNEDGNNSAYVDDMLEGVLILKESEKYLTYVVNKTDNTFQISTVKGGNEIVPINQKAKIDKYRFERINSLTNVRFNKLPDDLQRFKIVINGAFFKAPKYYYYNDTTSWGAEIDGGILERTVISNDGNISSNTLFGSIEITVSNTTFGIISNTNCGIIGYNSDAKLIDASDHLKNKYISFETESSINNIQVRDIAIGNGCRIELHKA